MSIININPLFAHSEIISNIAQSSRAVEYTDCFSKEEE